MKLEVRNIDEVLAAWDGPGGAAARAKYDLAFTPLGHFESNAKDATFLNADGLNAKALAKYKSVSKEAAGKPVGMFEFSDVYLMPPLGLIVDRRNGVCWTGSRIQWTRPYAAGKLAKFSDDDFASVNIPFEAGDFDAAPSLESVCLVAGGGYKIYGHWIVDVVPRMYLAAAAGYAASPHYSRPEKPWAEKLAEIVAPGSFSISPEMEAALLHVKRLLVPSSVRRSGALAAEWSLKGWDDLGRKLERLGPVAPYGLRKIVVSRHEWSRKQRKSAARISNIEVIERRFAKAGYSIIHPETMSFAEQRQMFSEADVVVGEDGSGLHNAVFGKPGAILGVVSSNRINTIHAAIADAKGQNVTYIGETDADADAAPEIRVRPRLVDAAIAEIDAVARQRFGG